MNREIKFRCWDSNEKKWLKNFEIHMYDGESHLHENYYTELNDDDEPNRYIISQYIGVNDKNGKEIYEGDIIESSFYKYEIKYVKLDGGCGCGRQNSPGDGLGFNIPWYEIEKYSIVGNIFENPELIEDIN